MRQINTLTYSECIHTKVDPLQIQMIYCSYLFNQKLVIFGVIRKKNPQNGPARLFTPDVFSTSLI